MSVNWSEIELERAARVIAEIDACVGPRRLTCRIPRVRIAVSEIAGLCDGIWGSFPVTFIRHLYRELGFDEHRVFRWRLEHKLVQALVLNHYAPACIPATCGLAGWSGPIFFKPTLGDSSGDRQPINLVDETFIVQERIPIAVEYRVHSLEDRVIDDLTFHRYGKGDIPGERDAPNAFVQSVLDRLPNALTAGNLCGWDVARTPDDRFLVVEVNFSGFHPVHNRGFQCSGWFHDEEWGALSAARLVRFLEESCGVAVEIQADRPDFEIANRFYAEVDRCRQLLHSGVFT